MSLYRQGVQAAFVRVTRENIGAERGSQAEWDAANAVLQAAIKEIARTFPASFAALKAAEMLDKAAIYGRSMRGKYAGFFSGVDTSGIEVAINAADDAGKKWRNKIPIFGDGFIYQQNKNREWAEVQGQVFRPYIEAAGLIGQKAVITKAREELAQDLNPISPVNLSKIAVIVAIAAAGATFLPGLLNKLQAKVTR